MKSNAGNSTSSAKSTSSKRHAGTNKKSSTSSRSMPVATQKSRGKTTHGHGMNNEGTNTSYDEQR